MIWAFWAMVAFSVSFLIALFVAACMDRPDDWEQHE